MRNFPLLFRLFLSVVSKKLKKKIRKIIDEKYMKKFRRKDSQANNIYYGKFLI